MRKTKIICTIGPASEDKENLTQLIEQGMNVARLNFSHGEHSEHKKRIDTIRQVATETGSAPGNYAGYQRPGDYEPVHCRIKK